MGRSSRRIKPSTHQHMNKYAKFSKKDRFKPMLPESNEEKNVVRDFRKDVIDKTLDEKHYISFNSAYSYSGLADNFEERAYSIC